MKVHALIGSTGGVSEGVGFVTGRAGNRALECGRLVSLTWSISRSLHSHVSDDDFIWAPKCTHWRVLEK